MQTSRNVKNLLAHVNMRSQSGREIEMQSRAAAAQGGA